MKLGQGQIITYNRMIYNGTTAYSPLSGIFTVPVSGVYLFSWTANAKKLTGEPIYEIDNILHVNGQRIATSFAHRHPLTLWWGQMVKIHLFQNMVMLHIKLN